MHRFVNTDGAFPWARLVQGDDGNLYGTTQNGGNMACAMGCGTLFEITANGKVTTVYFNGTNGSDPYAGLIQAPSGEFYGTTATGGSSNGGGNCPNNCGTVFKVTRSGKLITLHNFNYNDGFSPLGTLLLADDGNLYGTTDSGGFYGAGTVFKITTSGRLTTLHTFSNAAADGGIPTGALIEATDGNFYGTTISGGVGNFGAVFKITPRGTLTTIHSFASTDGAVPFAGLMQASDGYFYGTTEEGGTKNYGTVFKMTANGTLTTLHSFLGGADGDTPTSPLVQANDGNFYGTAAYDGQFPNFGKAFEITSNGKLTTLHNFNSTEGSYPYAGLLQDTNGGFYGSTFAGGSSSACRFGCGTLYSLSVGLGPFVETLPTSGKIGTVVTVLGTNLRGATGVTFNGTAAKFTIVSDSALKTTVPAGATTGVVTVKSNGNTLTSNLMFRIR